MACVALISLIRTLELEFLEPRPRKVLDNKEQIQYLHERLSLLQALLEESEKKLCASGAMKDLIAKVKGIAFKAEDDIESQVIEILSTGNQPTSHEGLHQILQSLLEEIEGVIECTKKRNIEESFTPQLIRSSNHEHIILGGSDQRTSKLEDAMVGHTEEFAKMKEMLLQRSPQERQVVPIIGMGGIGKTTFAKRICGDPSIRSHFDLLGWATVSQDNSLRKILHDLCHSIDHMTDDEINKIGTTDDLANKLRQRLMGRRYLLVVDNIWGARAWDDVHRCFPDNFNGSRILLTTRLKEVADYTGSGKYICNLPFLNSDESWKLFCQKVSIKESLPLELEKIGRRIVHKCEGLPLAIAVAGGLLSKTNKSLENWQNIASAINLPVTSDLHEQCSNILTLSYNNLPYHLKACFLYFGVFPEDNEIPSKDLINLWIAEGFVKKESQKHLEEVAKKYLQDLIDRNLVLISKLSFRGNIKACKIHDLLHDLCLREAKDEKLVSIIHQGIGRVELNGYQQANRWLRFLARPPSPKFEEYIVHKSRTLLLFFGDDDSFIFPFPWRLNISFKMIRVLDLRSINLNVVPNFDLVDLVLLRYLALTSLNYFYQGAMKHHRNLRGVMKHHWNLQTLIVTKYEAGIEKDVDEWLRCIWKSQNLRYIECPYPFPKCIDEDLVQENLHTMHWLPYSQCTEQFFLRIPNVKVLGITCNDVFQTKTWWDNLRYLSELEELIVHDRPQSSPLPSIEAFPQKLKKLILVGARLKWKAITVISMLPNLEMLKLARAWDMGREWETSESGFLRLKFLFISGTFLKYWNTTGDHFPILERLTLRLCNNLKEIPMDFADVTTLQLIELHGCYSSLVESARKIQEQQQDLYGNDELVVRDYYTGASIQ